MLDGSADRVTHEIRSSLKDAGYVVTQSQVRQRMTWLIKDMEGKM